MKPRQFDPLSCVKLLSIMCADPNTEYLVQWIVASDFHTASTSLLLKFLCTVNTVTMDTHLSNGTFTNADSVSKFTVWEENLNVGFRLKNSV